MIIDNFSGDYEFLSNFYPCNVVYDGLKFETTEHAFQAAKTLNIEERLQVMACDTPGKAKRMGRKVTLRPDWDQVKVQVMTDIVRQKFTDLLLARKLLETGDTNLIEGNTWNDRFWGVCNGKGENNLGKILMKVREELRGQNVQ